MSECENRVVVYPVPDGAAMPEGRLVYIEAGIHYIGEFIWHLPSHTRIYLEGGAILKGALVCDHVKDVTIFGRGMLYLANFERFSSTNGLRLSHSRDITVENLMFVNPPHYTIYLETSVICGYDENFLVRNVRISDFYRDGVRVQSLKEANIEVGKFTEGVSYE